MRRFAIIFAALVSMLMGAALRAEEGKVCKVLPQFLDEKGRQSLSPSLYERDAYQFYLRKHPKERTALHLAIEWKAKGVNWTNVMLRAELRGLRTNTLQNITLEEPVKKTGWFSSWAEFNLTGSEFQKFGELVAWRVTLSDGKHELSQLQSFLWDGVPPAASQ